MQLFFGSLTNIFFLSFPREEKMCTIYAFIVVKCRICVSNTNYVIKNIFIAKNWAVKKIEVIKKKRKNTKDSPSPISPFSPSVKRVGNGSDEVARTHLFTHVIRNPLSELYAEQSHIFIRITLTLFCAGKGWGYRSWEIVFLCTENC